MELFAIPLAYIIHCLWVYISMRSSLSPVVNGVSSGSSLILILSLTLCKKYLVLTLVLGLSLIRNSAAVREPYVFQCFSISEKFKSIQVLKLSLKNYFAILSEVFETLKMLLLISENAPQSVRALVTVLGTSAMFLSYYIMCKIVYRSDWLVPLFAF